MGRLLPTFRDNQSRFSRNVGVLVICVLVFTVFRIVCTVFFVLFRLCVFILICFVSISVRATATK